MGSTTGMKTVRVSSSEGMYLGEVYIDRGQFATEGTNQYTTAWLDKLIDRVWERQRGIPTFRKEGVGFSRGQDGRYILDKYLHHGNCSSDELLEAFYDYHRAFGVYGVEIVDKRTE